MQEKTSMLHHHSYDKDNDRRQAMVNHQHSDKLLFCCLSILLLGAGLLVYCCCCCRPRIDDAWSSCATGLTMVTDLSVFPDIRIAVLIPELAGCRLSSTLVYCKERAVQKRTDVQELCLKVPRPKSGLPSSDSLEPGGLPHGC